MSEHISAKELPLSKIFSADYEFHIPPYQRPYAWTTDEAGKLFEDLIDFYQSANKDKDGKLRTVYFLGSIVLIQRDKDYEFDVVDGQQRLTTLTILIATLIHVFSTAENKNEFIEYIKQPQSKSKGLPEKMRLFLREKDEKFFCENIQQCNFEKLEKQNIANLNDSQKLILKNTNIFIEKLKEQFSTEEQLEKFGMFLMSNCYLVVVSTTDVDSAFRIFSVMNSRGLDLLPTDILKSEIIGKIQTADQKKYTEAWENEEEALSREGFAELFSHIRMLYTGQKPVKTLKEEFVEAVVKNQEFPTSEKLLDDLVFPCAKAFEEISTQSYKCKPSDFAKDVNNYLKWLNRIDISDWKPAAIAFHIQHQNDAEYLAWFYKKLERLAAYLFISSATAQERITRFRDVVNEIKVGKDSLDAPLKSIELNEVEKSAMLDILEGDIYDNLTWLRCKYIVMRLDGFVSDKAAQYDQKIISIEHILPQEMSKEWKRSWKGAEHEEWLNKIANLVLLSRRKNAQAQNYAFDVKKKKYLQTDNTSSFALTSQVLEKTEWTPKIVEERQKELMKIFKKKWEL